MATRKHINADVTHRELNHATRVDTAPKDSGGAGVLAGQGDASETLTTTSSEITETPQGSRNNDFAADRPRRVGSTSVKMLTPDDRLCRKAEVLQRVGLSESSIWRLEQKGKFPARIRVTQRCTVWLESEINHWIADPANYTREVSQ